MILWLAMLLIVVALETGFIAGCWWASRDRDTTEADDDPPVGI